MQRHRQSLVASWRRAGDEGRHSFAEPSRSRGLGGKLSVVQEDPPGMATTGRIRRRQAGQRPRREAREQDATHAMPETQAMALGGVRPAAEDAPALDRMGLAAPRGLRERLMRRALALALEKTR